MGVTLQFTMFASGNRRRLIWGLAIIAVISVADGLVGTFIIQGADVHTRTLYENSLNSIEEVTTIAQQVDHERILIDDHVFQHEPVGMASIEQQLFRVTEDLKRAATRYESYVDLPGERELWTEARRLLGRFSADIDEVLELSRADRDEAAHLRMAAALKDYNKLRGRLIDLIHLNHTGAVAAMQRVSELHQKAETLEWVTRIVGVIALLLVGWWGVRGIDRYERQITERSTELEERNRDLDAFAGRVAHDLKNTLAPIAMAPSMLKRWGDDPTRVYETAASTT